jgi:hypothetical protein
MAVFVVEMPNVKAPITTVDGPVLVSNTSNSPEPPAVAVADWTETTVLPCASTARNRKAEKTEVEYFM